MNRPRTRELLAQARAGASEAQHQLFHQVADRLILYIRLRLGSGLATKVDPLDIMQESLLVAHQRSSEFEDRGEGSYVAWLCRIADFQIRKLCEKESAKKRKPQGERQPYSAILDQVRDSAVGPLTAAVASERRAALLEAIASEDEDSRRIVLARYFESRSFEEIAQDFGSSATSIRRRLATIAGRLGHLLSGLESRR